MVNDRKRKGHDCGNPYGGGNRKEKDFGGGSKPSRGELKCYKCGGFRHYANKCKKDETCYKCGKAGHKSFECKSKEVVCYI